MPPTLLIVGATGNTGRTVVSHLSTQLPSHPTLRILALTRSASSPTATHLSTLPGVEICEKNWVDIDSAWLQDQNVSRAFIAPHNAPNQFAEESGFHLAALQAGVEYVVRISTTAANVSPVCKAYYPRSHWAIEQLLSSEEFSGLGWTSLQPNVFAQLYLGPAVELVKEYRKSGKQDVLRLMANESAPVGIIDPREIGTLAATLLLQADTSSNRSKKYVLNGPEDITGAQIVAMVEKEIGAKVQDVRFKDMGFVEQMAEAAQHESKSVIMSIKHAPETAWEGKCSASTTSREVLELAAPRKTAGEVFREMLEG